MILEPEAVEELRQWARELPITRRPVRLEISAEHEQLRCVVTKNLCGTDTWMSGKPCPCPNCRLYFDGSIVTRVYLAEPRCDPHTRPEANYVGGFCECGPLAEKRLL